MDPESFWEMLVQGVDAVTEVPASRWPISVYFDAEKGRSGKTYSKWGAFLPEIDRFDPGFFGIPGSEAAAMDPQQRLLLETAWESMEDAGYVLNPRGERTGVFVGISTRDYELIQGSCCELNDVSPFSATGLASSIASNRLSYCFNLTGPSVSVDTACSSSLMAVHLACQSLWNEECEAAIAAGVNCLISPSNYLAFSSMGLLSPDGRCRSFDARGNGFVRGEGAGALLLQPLDKALARGARIYAVIMGTGANQDGQTPGLAFPSRDSQAALLRKVSRDAGIAPYDLVYVEAHGTGTAAGDPVETSALGEVFGAGRQRGSELLIGSVKSNIGHLESGAGIAGIIKCALCLKYGAAPPNLHFESPNPAIDFDGWRLRVPTRVEPFPETTAASRVWYAGVNSFGFGGSNAFVLLGSQPPAQEQQAANSQLAFSLPIEKWRPPVESSFPKQVPISRPRILTISTREADVLPLAAKQYAEFLDVSQDSRAWTVDDVVHAAAVQRSHHRFRLSVVGRCEQEIGERLRAFAGGEASIGVVTGEAAQRTGIVFVFSGQGAQWYAMGRRLYETEPVFRETFERCHAALPQCGGWSLLDEFLADESSSRMMETAIAQPSICAVQIALTAQWAHWGVRPAAVVGHSVGEVAAAWCAGVFSLEEAMQIIFHRGDTMARALGDCGMLAASLSAEDARQFVKTYDGTICIGAINSPQSVTLSGENEALKHAATVLTEQGVWNKAVPVNYAFHSRQMDPVQEPLRKALEHIVPRPAQIPLYSTVTGQRAEGTELAADYWWRNVRQTVNFAPAIEALAHDGFTTYLEVAAHPVLSTSMKQTLEGFDAHDEMIVLPSLRRQDDDHLIMLQSLGTLHCLGYSVNWNELTPRLSDRFVRLPTYPWKRERHWNESPDWKSMRNWEQPHPLLMRRIAGAVPTWLCLINSRLLPWLKDHALQGRPLFPAAGYLELALAAATEVYPQQFCLLQDVELERALFVTDGGRGIDVHIRVDPSDHQFSILSGTETDGWTRNARGFLRLRKSAGASQFVELDEIRGRCRTELDADGFYAKARQCSFHYGPTFRGIQHVWRRDGEAVALIRQHPAIEMETGRYNMHPSLLDACIQLAFVVMNEDDPQAPAGMFLPNSVHRLQLFSPLPNQFFAHAELVKQGRSTLVVNIRAVAEDGRLLASLDGVRFRPMEGTDDENFLNWFYQSNWIRKPLPETDRQVLNEIPEAVLPEIAQLAEELKKGAAARCRRMQLPRLIQGSHREIRQLQAVCVWDALQELGWYPALGDDFSLESLSQQLGIADESQLVLQRGLQTLCEQSWLTYETTRGRWRVVSHADPGLSVSALWRSLADRCTSLLTELMLLKHWSENLVRRLTGEAETTRSEELSRLHDQAMCHATHWMPSQLAVREAVSRIAAGLPDGRRLRILEIGAGSSGLSSHVAAELTPEIADYVLTDSRENLPSAIEDRIRVYGFGDCRVLNLNADIRTQGFEPGQFDVVIGQDSFTAADKREAAMKRAATLLAPGGILIFSSWDSGAWMAEVDDLITDPVENRSQIGVARPSRSAWQKMLEEAGFASVDWISDLDDDNEMGRTVYLAQRAGKVADGQSSTESPAEEHVPISPNSDVRQWLILADRGGVGYRLAERLREAGHTVCCETPESGFDRLELLVTPEVQGIIHLWSLDAPVISDDLAITALKQSQLSGAQSVLRLVQAVAGRSASIISPRFWLVTRAAQPIGLNATPVSLAQAPLLGLGRVLMNEQPDLKCRMVDLAPGVTIDEDLQGLWSELFTEDRDEQVALRGQVRYVERVGRMSSLDAPEPGDRGMPDQHPCQLKIGQPGMMDQLRLRPIERCEPGPDEVEVAVCAAGLNFRDVMKCLGVYPGDAPDANSLGDEFGGVVLRVGSNVREHRVGDRVFGVCLGAMATHVTVHASVCLPLPAEMSFEEAATIPVVYLTAYHALHQLAHAAAGERILIHSAAGGVGWAAVRLALKAGLEVYGTAGSPMKRQLLRSVGVHHVLNSRTLEFADEIMALTNEEGIDIVLNSLAGEAIPRSLELLRLYGRFLEIGKRDIYGGTAISLKPFQNSLSYHAIDMARTLVPPYAGPLLNDISGLMKSGTIAPLPSLSFPFSEAGRAFRHMAQGKHIGKIVLTVDQSPVSRRKAYKASRAKYRSDATYLITGGLRGMGLFLAEHLASRGARHLVLTSQSGPESVESQAGLARLRDAGVQVFARKSDITSEHELAELLREIDRDLPPLVGVIHAATVYSDGLLREMDAATYEKPLGPKAWGAWNLHQQTCHRSLDLFVMISSVSAVIGNAGQANYVSANLFLDHLAHYRRSKGLPALSLQLDRIQDVGHVARNEELADYFARLRWWGISSAQAAEGLDRLLENQSVVALLSSFKWTRSSSGIGTLLGSPRFEQLVRDESMADDGSAGIRHRLDNAAPEEKPDIVRDFLVREIADVLRTSARRLPQSRPLKEIGLDSLMAVELMSRIDSKLGMSLPVAHLSADATVMTLTDAALSQLGITVKPNSDRKDELHVQ
jgi:acyl transferase domain-containing protein/NADPH:quinone reductase-like Zn-dependent oxidoreductase/acyl carrier protein